MTQSETLRLANLKKQFINKVINNWEKKYPSIKNHDFKNINLAGLVDEVLEEIDALIVKEIKDSSAKKNYQIGALTLRRIFENTDKHIAFQTPTKNGLALYLGNKSYNDFIKKEETTIDIPDESISHQEKIIAIEKKKKLIPIFFVGLFACISMVIFIVQKKARPIIHTKPRITKVTLENNQAPMTANLEYDLGNLDFKNAHLDYNLNFRLKSDTMSLDTTKKNVSIYFLHPTSRFVRLMIDNKCVDSVKIIVPSDGWVAGYDYIYYVDKSKWKKNHEAHISESDVLPSVRERDFYYSFIKKVAGFEQINCDNFNVETSLKNPGPLCNDMNVVLIGSENKLELNFTQNGCSYYSYLRLPGKELEGKTYDLKNLTVNTNEFTKIRVSLNNQKAAIFIADKMIFATNYDKKLGDLEAIYIGFLGLGTVQYVKLTDALNHKTLELEEF